MSAIYFALIGTFALGALGGMAAAVVLHLGSLDASSAFPTDEDPLTPERPRLYAIEGGRS